MIVKLASDASVETLGTPELLPLKTHRLAHLGPGTTAYVAEAYTR